MFGIIPSLLSRAVANLYAFKATCLLSSSFAECTLFFWSCLKQIWVRLHLVPTEATVDIMLSVGLVLCRNPAVLHVTLSYNKQYFSPGTRCSRHRDPAVLVELFTMPHEKIVPKFVRTPSI